MSRAAPWPITLPKEQAAPSGAKADHFLARVARLTDWRPIESALGVIPVHAATRPRYPSLLLFKIVLLQQWYGLSDPGAEYAVNDRKAFTRFVGLPEGAPCPSLYTINRFRAELVRRDLGELLLNMVAEQLQAKDLKVREGAMVEPSLIDISKRPH